MTTTPNILRTPIIIVPAGMDLETPNRFLTKLVPVHHFDLEESLKLANCKNISGIEQYTFDVHHGVSSDSMKFVIVRFEHGPYETWKPVNYEFVTEQFEKAGLRHADFQELLSFVAAEPEILRNVRTLIALGQDSEFRQKQNLQSRPLRLKLWQMITRSTPRIKIQYPCVSYSSPRSLLKTAEKHHQGWQSHCYFLAVIRPWGFEEKLVDMPITMDDYMSIPLLSTEDIKKDSIGRLFRVPDGSIRRIVAGHDMLQTQWGGMSIPEIGFVHYRPVFVP
jgi:hypothetical protein